MAARFVCSSALTIGAKITFAGALLGGLLAACGPAEEADGDNGSGANTGGAVSGGSPSTGGEVGSGGLPSAGGTSSGGGTGGDGSPAGGSGGLDGGSGGEASGGTGGDVVGSGGATGGTGGDAGSGGATGGSGGGSNEVCPLPSSFSWTSSGSLAEPKSPAGQNFVSLKDFTIARAGDTYAVYATAFNRTSENWTGVFIGFSDWSEFGSAPQTWLGSRATVAPQIMYFSPKNIWVLTYQWGFQYATSTDPTDPTSWSQGKSLLTGNPTQGHGGTGPIDQTVICDDTTCYMFFAGDNGRIYRGSMPIGNFPAAFTNTTQIMQDTTANLFEGVEVYSVKGSDQYLMIVEAMGSGGRYFRAFTSTDLGGTFTPMPQASTENTPFAGKRNVTFNGNAWTNDISHGDIVRDDPSEKKVIDPCDLKFLYQGRNPAVGGEYGHLPYRPGLLTLVK